MPKLQAFLDSKGSLRLILVRPRRRVFRDVETIRETLRRILLQISVYS
jgi:hypothetical protein